MKTNIATLIGVGLLLLCACAKKEKPTATLPLTPTLVATATPTLAPTDAASPTPDPTTSAPQSESERSGAEPANAVAAGLPLTYTLTVANRGPSNATGVVVTDTLPAGVVLVSARTGQGPGCSFSDGNLTCVLGDLALGASTKVTVVVRPITATGKLAQTAIVAANEADPDVLDNALYAETAVAPVADLAIRADAPGLVAAGGTLVYTLTVANGGPSPATNVVVTDTLPAGTTYAWSTPSHSACDLLTPSETVPEGVLLCELGDLVSGDTITVALDLTAGTTRVAANSAPPPGVTLDLSTPTCQVSEAGVVTCRLGSLASGTETQVRVAATVETSVTGTLTHTAAVAAVASDPDLANNAVGVATAVGAATPLTATTTYTTADLSVQVSAPDQAIAGAPLTYTFTVVNNGPLPASDVALRAGPLSSEGAREVNLLSVNPGMPTCRQSEGVMTCHLRRAQGGGSITFTLVLTYAEEQPPAVALDAFLPGWPTCSLSPSSVECHLGDLASGDETQVTLMGQVGGLTSGPITATATVRADEPDFNLADNEAAVRTTVGVEADLTIGFGTSGLTVAGQPLTYTLLVTNSGPSHATGVVVTDTLPSGMTFVSANPAGVCRADKANQITCTLGQLDGGDAATLTIVVAIDAAATGAFARSATVLAEQFDPDESNNEVTEFIQVNSEADLSITHGPWGAQTSEVSGEP